MWLNHRVTAKIVTTSRHARDVTPLEREVKVKLHTPQRAITPGQAAVFYQTSGGGRVDYAVSSCRDE